jgi:hypothetical protein
MMTPVMMRTTTGHGLGCDCFSAISRGFRIAGGLLYAARRSLRLRGRLLRLGGRSFGAGRGLVRAVGRIGSALGGIRAAGPASCRKRKG